MGAHRSTATLRGNDGDPTIEVLIGQRQLGTYRVLLKKTGDEKLAEIGAGNSDDTIDDEFRIGGVGDLHGAILICDTLILKLATRPGDNYHVSLVVRQKDQQVPGGLITEGGRLKGDTPVVGRFDLVVAQ